MAIQSKDLTYVVGGVDMRSCYYVDPTAKGKRPGILVYPDASGLDHVAHAGARRLAEEGYAALACDLYGAGRVINDQPQAVEFAKKLVGDLTALAANGEAAFAALGSQAEVDPSKIAGMGYCLGGNVVVELARSGVPLAAIIGFHGGAVRAGGMHAGRIARPAHPIAWSRSRRWSRW